MNSQPPIRERILYASFMGQAFAAMITAPSSEVAQWYLFAVILMFIAVAYAWREYIS